MRPTASLAFEIERFLCARTAYRDIEKLHSEGIAMNTYPTTRIHVFNYYETTDGVI